MGQPEGLGRAEAGDRGWAGLRPGPGLGRAEAGTGAGLGQARLMPGEPGASFVPHKGAGTHEPGTRCCFRQEVE